MKFNIVKTTALSLALGALVSSGLFAQNTPTSTNSSPSSSTTKAAPVKPATSTATTKNTTTSSSQAQPAQPKKAEASATHKEMSKDDWMKHYNEMKPKLDAMQSNAKMESKNPEFTGEVTKLNQMAADYKAKLDNWDKITPDKREAYEKELRSAHKAMNEQYEKTKAMWNKMHPAEKKAEPAKQAPK